MFISPSFLDPYTELVFHLVVFVGTWHESGLSIELHFTVHC